MTDLIDQRSKATHAAFSIFRQIPSPIPRAQYVSTRSFGECRTTNRAVEDDVQVAWNKVEGGVRLAERLDDWW